MGVLFMSVYTHTSVAYKRLSSLFCVLPPTSVDRIGLRTQSLSEVEEAPKNALSGVCELPTGLLQQYYTVIHKSTIFILIQYLWQVWTDFNNSSTFVMDTLTVYILR